MKNKIEKKRKKEQLVVADMIRIYCKRHHNQDAKRNGFCTECQLLYDYAQIRSEKCPFMEHKNFCANCKVHCYKPEMRMQMKKVMRFSGPWMLLYHPILAIWHLILSIREKKIN